MLTRKKSGDLRFCVDFRRLNDLVNLDEFEIPRINELLNELHDKKFFTLIDLKDGFFQIKIAEEDRKKTAFYTGKKLMQFACMPQGYKNSPAIFQRAMNIIFQDLIDRICLIYIDDILIFGENKIKHDKNLETVLKRIKEYGLVENIHKRQECLEEINFLGYRISLNKIKPLVKRCQGILDYATPKTKKQLQRLLGVINYDRNFINGITELAKPFYNLLNKEQKLTRNADLEASFIKIKRQWTQELEFYIPDLAKRFQLETDASNEGIGAVLRQESRPVIYISKSLNKV